MICVMYCSKSLNTGRKLAWEKKDSETDFFKELYSRIDTFYVNIQN